MDFKKVDTKDYTIIEATKASPYVFFDKKKQTLKLCGNSILDNSHAFYSLIYSELKNFLDQPCNKQLTVYFHFIYLNTQAVKEILNIINLLESSDVKAKIVWYYSDDEVNDLGMQLKELTNIDFDIIFKTDDRDIDI